jgi:hypothetical protein
LILETRFENAEGAATLVDFMPGHQTGSSVVRLIIGGRGRVDSRILGEKQRPGFCSLRLVNRVQITTDGHRPYLEAIEGSFGADVDYAMLVKIYGTDAAGEKRYSPAECIGAVKHRVEGNPDPKHVSTSYAERQNLTLRMSSRRFTRLTNAFSKKVENHALSVSLHYMNYNFCRIHKTLRVTPAMAAGVTDRLWEVADIVKILEKWEVTE